jgi:pimeloyl-ACP methyl ester carboxylesterase
MKPSPHLALACFWLTGACWAAAGPDCHLGAYLLEDGRAVDIGHAADGGLRWRANDGTTGALHETAGVWDSTLGWTDRADGHRLSFGDCGQGRIVFDGVPGTAIPLPTTDVRFRSGDLELAGRLVMPPGKQRVPLVILVHGSEDSSARELFALQRQLPAAGVGAFVYDKRGTGDSAGIYTHDYRVLAADAAAAVREARRLAGARAGRVGLQGSSQGGWVAPLAATLTPVDFVIVGYGLAVSPIDEDREAVALDMARHGFGAEETRRALEVADAIGQIIRSGFRAGYDRLDALRARYSGEPWFRYLRGNITGVLLGQSESWLREHGPQLLNGVIPDYDPMPVLRALKTPQLWILGADDIDAPIGETMDRLRALRRAGQPISIVVYPRAEHGIFEYELDAQGGRVSTRQPATYLGLMCEFARRGAVSASLGDAIAYR